MNTPIWHASAGASAAAPGGSSEIVARSIAVELTKQRGQLDYGSAGNAGAVRRADRRRAEKRWGEVVRRAGIKPDRV
jgi:hypothetical protein